MTCFFDIEFRLPIQARGRRIGDLVDVRASLHSEHKRVVMYGASGAGKSSIIEGLLGWRRLESGRISIGGEVLFDSEKGISVSPSRRRFGYLPQDVLLFPHLSVEQNIRSGMVGRRARSGSGVGLFDRAVEMLELGSLLARSTARLSGGERHRIGLARALISDPRVLVLDEPLATLDPGLKTRVLSDLLLVCEELELPLLLVSHDQVDGQVLCEFAQLIDRGRVVAEGSPREIFHRVAAGGGWDSQVAAQNVLWGRPVLEHRDNPPSAGEVELAGGQRMTLPKAEGGARRIALALGADEVLLATERPGPTSASNLLTGAVVALEDRGDLFLVSVALDRVGALEPEAVGPEEIPVIDVDVAREIVAEFGLEVGTVAFLLFKRHSVRLLATHD